MVHRSGSTQHFLETAEHGDTNAKSKNNYYGTCSEDANASALMTSDKSLLSISSFPEVKPKLRTSKRLNSLNPDLLTLPKEKSSSLNIETNDSSGATEEATTSTAANCSNIQTGGLPKLSAGGQKLIRNRRYTITDCVHSNDKRNSVPFFAQKTENNSSNDVSTSNKLNCSNKSRFDLCNLPKDSLNCSVSLERLTGIIDTLICKTNLSNSDKDETTAANKILCMYCDRSFLSKKLYAKHVDRVHQSMLGRRISARTLNNVSQSNYPGCSYCNTGKVTCLQNEELIPLVYHLVDVHSDKYFACTDCMIRFATREILTRHFNEVHMMTRKTTKNVQSSVDNPLTSPLSVQVDFDLNDTSDASYNEPNLRNRLRRPIDTKNKHLHLPNKQLLTNEETFLTRLGIAHNRSPRSKKGAKNRRGCSSELFQLECQRLTRGNKNSKTIMPSANETAEFVTPKQSNSKVESNAAPFDDDFYESVIFNVKHNLSCHLDGKLESGSMLPSPLHQDVNAPTLRSILVKSPIAAEAEIHEATTISSFTAFPTLLTAQQYGSDSLVAGKIKKPITKNSWKWKWDCVKKYKYVNEGGKIVKKVKQPTCGMRDLSKLDMWTQLTMRTKHEIVARRDHDTSGEENMLSTGDTAREEKRQLFAQLNKILDRRVLPQINLEQNDQTIVKLEVIDELKNRNEINSTASLNNVASESSLDQEFPALINLFKIDHTANDAAILLSGEWARPRCYICVGCGSLFSTVRSLEEHKASKHPFVHSTHYEIVGKELIDGDLFRNFYIPSAALQLHNEYNKKQFFSTLCSAEDSMDSDTSYSMSGTKSDSFDMDSNSRNSKVSISSATCTSGQSYSTSADDENTNISSVRALPVKSHCSKCNRKCNAVMDLYRHMLDCSSDYQWILAKKRNHIKYRYFGSRRRRAHRSNSTTMQKTTKPKKEAHNNSDTVSQKSKEPLTPRQRPSDAESIQRMLANLPAKRAVRQIFPNLTPSVRKKKFVPNTVNRKKILVKQKSMGNARSFKIVSASTTINTIETNLALRKKRNVESRRIRRSAEVSTNVVSRLTRSTFSAALENAQTESDSKKSASSSIRTSSLNKFGDRLPGKTNDLGRVFRRRTKAVVAKISNTFRRGNTKRMLHSSTRHLANTKTSDSTNTRTDKNNLILKSKRTFLRTFSFHHSNRIIKKKNTTEISTTVCEEIIEDDKKKDDGATLLNEEPNEEKTKVETAALKLCIEQKYCKESETDTSLVVIANPPETSRLKRTRSFKKTINDLQAKSQSQDTDEPPKPLDSTEISFVSPIVAPATVAYQTPATVPLSLIIQPMDMPLNLCMSPRKTNPNIAVTDTSDPAAKGAPMNTMRSPTSFDHLTATQAENISPRRRARKLTDCIAMLTGKLQEKLGVPFIDLNSTLLPILSPGNESVKAASTNSVQTDEAIDLKIPAKISKMPDIVHTAATANDSVNVTVNNTIEDGKLLNQVELGVFRTDDDNDTRKRRCRKTKETSKIILKKNDTDDLRKSPKTTPSAITLDKESESEHLPSEIANESTINNTTEATDTTSANDTAMCSKNDQNTTSTLSAIAVGLAELDEAQLVEKVTINPTDDEVKRNDQITIQAEKLEITDCNVKLYEVNQPLKCNLNAEPIASEEIKPLLAENERKSKQKANKNLESKRNPNAPECIASNIASENISMVPEKNIINSEPIENAMSKESPQIDKVFNDHSTINDRQNLLKPTNRATRSNVQSSDDVIALIPTKETLPEVLPSQTETGTKKNKKSFNVIQKLRKKPTKRSKISNTNGNESIAPSPSKKFTKKISPTVPSKQPLKLAKTSENKMKKATERQFSNPSENKKKKTVAKEEVAATDESLSTIDVQPVDNVEQTTRKQKPKKTSRNASTKKNQANIVNVDFDTGNDELLPWDPETGFVVNEKQNDNPKTEVESVPTTVNEIPKEQLQSADSTVPIVKKKRRNELAQIIADQLLESFKVVDKSRIDELKKIHALSLSINDDLISSSLSIAPTQKRKSKQIIKNVEAKIGINTPKRQRKSKKVIAKAPKETVAVETVLTVDPIVVTEKPNLVEESTETCKEIPEKENNTTENGSCDAAVTTENVISNPIAVLSVVENKKVEKLSSTKQKKKSAVQKKKEFEGRIQTEIKEPAMQIPDKERNNVEAITIQKPIELAASEVPTQELTVKGTDETQNIFLSNVSATLSTNTISKPILLKSSASIPDVFSLNTTIDKNLFDQTAFEEKSKSMKIAKNLTKHAPTLFTGIHEDLSVLNTETKTKTNVVFGESLFSQKNFKKSLLNDFISQTDKEALPIIQPLKNKSAENLISLDTFNNLNLNLRAPFMSPLWTPNDDDANVIQTTNPVVADSSLNVFRQTIPRDRATDKSKKSRIFGAIKGKTKKLFSKISKKKYQKSLKKSACNSSSSTSSSIAANPTQKKLLLRPSILSCNNLHEKNDSNKSEEKPTQADVEINTESTVKQSYEELTRPNAIAIAINSHQIELQPQNKSKIISKGSDNSPKSPIESDMNIAKIAIALEKSNPKSLKEQISPNMDDVVSVCKTDKAPIKHQRKLKGAKVEKTSTETPALPLEISENVPIDDSLQDAIITQIAYNIREKAERTDSEDDMCLAEVAKELTKKSSSELSLKTTTEQSSEKHSRALASNIDKPTLEKNSTSESDENTEIEAVENVNEDDIPDYETTNTELIDMELEDDVSVYTAFSQATSTNSNRGIGRKTRKKKSILMKSNRRAKKSNAPFASPSESYHCDICIKSFRNLSGLNNHKTTITHISKLSEQEFLDSKNKEINSAEVTAQENKPEQMYVSTDIETTEFIPLSASPPSQKNDNMEKLIISASPKHVSSYTNQGGLEPFSSLGQNSCFSDTVSNTHNSPTSSTNRLALSQEERLFYECCSMLKGSDASVISLKKTEINSKPAIPKCNEQNSNIAHTAQSPRSHSSSRQGIPTLDLNQFNDISSDSNPAFSCPQVPSSSKTQKDLSLDDHTKSKHYSTDKRNDKASLVHRSSIGKGTTLSKPNKDSIERNFDKYTNSNSSTSFANSSVTMRTYLDAYSDMGDSLPSSQDTSDSENYAQTVLEWSNVLDGTVNNSMRSDGSSIKLDDSGYSVAPMQIPLSNESDGFRTLSHRSLLDSPLHSTSSQCSSVSRPRTKAALKGYDNIKVSIPTTRLDLKHALNRNPNSNGCKLATLADIALGNNVPLGLIQTPHIIPIKTNSKSNKTTQAANSDSKKREMQFPTIVVTTTSPILNSMDLKAKIIEATSFSAQKNKKHSHTRHQLMDNKLGFKERKKKSRNNSKTSTRALKSCISTMADPSKPRDVYDFEESHDSVENAIIPLTHKRPYKSELISKVHNSTEDKVEPTKLDNNAEDESSYSDRDDYYNFIPISNSGNSGTEDCEDTIPDEDEASDKEISPRKKSIKETPNSQRKCVIMGRIFKNAKKKLEPVIKTQVKKTAIPKQELDEIFDNLRSKTNKSETKSMNEMASSVICSKSVENKTETKIDLIKEQAEINERVQRASAKSRKSREVANLEAELGMSMEQIKDLVGVGKRKTQRRCATKSRKNCVETWSSDEYEEFHSTKDIIALIQEAEMKAQRSKARSAKQTANNNSIEKKTKNEATKSVNETEIKSDKNKERNRKKKMKISFDDNIKTKIDQSEKVVKIAANRPKSTKGSFSDVQSEGDSDFDEHWNKTAKRAKIRNRRRTIATREELLVEDKPKVKSRSKSKQSTLVEATKKIQPIPDTGIKKKETKLVENSQMSSGNKISKDGKSTPRRNRIASEMLYYWSSSSDDEFGRIQPTENADEAHENHLEQHGWIVGDSHKKLVTLLAHAKGKKIEDCAVKESAHKRK